MVSGIDHAAHGGDSGAAVTPNSSARWPARAATAGAVTVTGVPASHRVAGRHG